MTFYSDHFSLRRLRTAGIACILSLGLLTACDTTTDPGLDGRTVTLEGRATTTLGYGKSASDVDGATVTAASVGANGSLGVHASEATTDGDGHYELNVDAASDILVVMASNSDYETRALVDIGQQNAARIRVMPLTIESTVEADTYVEAQENGQSHVTTADVALHVNADVAEHVRAGTSTTANLASAIAAATAASNEFVIRQGAHASAEVEDARNRQRHAFVDLQQHLHAAADASAEIAALDAFAESIVDAWTDAGIDLSTQAKARAAGVSAIANVATNLHSATRLEVRKQAMYLAALAKSLAVEAELEAAGASSGALSSIAAARGDLIADIRAAGSASALEQAWARFRSEALAGLALSTDLSEAAISSALSTVQGLRATLDAALTVAGSAAAVADAYVTFDAAAEAALTSSLTDSADANTAANVLLILSL